MYIIAPQAPEDIIYFFYKIVSILPSVCVFVCMCVRGLGGAAFVETRVQFFYLSWTSRYMTFQTQLNRTKVIQSWFKCKRKHAGHCILILNVCSQLIISNRDFGKIMCLISSVFQIYRYFMMFLKLKMPIASIQFQKVDLIYTIFFDIE